ncbi:MAG: hypothetical protein QXJ17_02125 [Nitrososphaeria archaeon]
MKLVFDELICLVVLVLILSQFQFNSSNVLPDRAMEVELVGTFIFNNSTSIFIRNVGSLQVDVIGVLIDGIYFHLDPMVNIYPGVISRVVLDQITLSPGSILVFFDGGGCCRVM